jgi:hypothetical protein
MKRFLIALGLGLSFFALSTIFTPEEVASQIGYQTNAATIVVTDNLSLPDGAAATPALRFTSDPDTGLYYTTTGINFAVGSTRSLFVTNTYAKTVAGSAAAPSWSFIPDGDTGMYSIGADNLGFSVGAALVLDLENTNAAGAGADLATISSTLGIMDGSDTVQGLVISLTNVDHTGSSNVVNGITIGNITGDAEATESAISIGTGWDAGILSFDGAVATPSYTFNGDPDTGFYLVAAARVGVTIASGLKYNFTATQFYPQIDGTQAAPVYAMLDTDTGFYSTSADGLGMSHGGNDLGQWYVATGTLTASQVRNLNTTPIEVIGAPGSGKAIIVESAQWMLDWNANAYDNVGAGEDLFLRYDTSVNEASGRCDSSSCINAAATADAFGHSEGIPDNLGIIPKDNEAIDVIILVGSWAAADLDANGDSPVHYLIRYRVVTLDLS